MRKIYFTGNTCRWRHFRSAGDDCSYMGGGLELGIGSRIGLGIGWRYFGQRTHAFVCGGGSIKDNGSTFQSFLWWKQFLHKKASVFCAHFDWQETVILLFRSHHNSTCVVKVDTCSRCPLWHLVTVSCCFHVFSRCEPKLPRYLLSCTVNLRL